MDSASRPLFEHATHIFGKKAEAGVVADALVVRGSFGWNNEGEPGKAHAFQSSKPTTSRGGDNDPPAPLGSWHVHKRLEIEVFYEEPPAPLLIPDPERHKV
jgi:hypothetical protein